MNSARELTNAYLAARDLLENELVTEPTRRQLRLFLTELDKDIAEAVRNRFNRRDSSAAD